MGISGAICGVWISAKGEGVEDTLDVVFLHGGEEGFVGTVVVGLGVCAYGSDVGSVNVFGCDEVETLFARCVRGGFMPLVEAGFPDHVADAVSDLEKGFNDVSGKGSGVKCQGPDFGDVCAERTVDA